MFYLLPIYLPTYVYLSTHNKSRLREKGCIFERAFDSQTMMLVHMDSHSSGGSQLIMAEMAWWQEQETV